QRAQIGVEAIVPRQELVELTAAGRVLILETQRLAGGTHAQHAPDHVLVNGGQLVARPWKETGDHRVALLDALGLRRTKQQRSADPGGELTALGLHLRAAQGPELIGYGTLERWDFRLHGQKHVT